MTDKLKERQEILEAAKKFTVGQRVLHTTEGVGYIEDIDLTFPPAVEVRWLTPNNELSVLSSCVLDARDLMPVANNVVPMPKSKEWWKEASEFCATVEAAMNEMEADDDK